MTTDPRQAQKMQEEMQREMQQIRVDASAGGGVISVAMNGAKELLEIRIDPEAVKGGDVEMLQDLIIAAVNEVRKRAGMVPLQISAEQSEVTKSVRPHFRAAAQAGDGDAEVARGRRREVFRDVGGLDGAVGDGGEDAERPGIAVGEDDDPRLAAELAEPLARAVHAAHQAGVVHRDLKPANVLLTEAGEPRVTDFGLAKKLDDRGQTQTGAILGTPAYMPPEQARGITREIDARSDLWAVGAIMFSLLTGRFVHEGESVNEVLVAAATEPAAPVRTLVSDLPAAVGDIIDRALMMDKRHRWPNAAAMRDALLTGHRSGGRDVLPGDPVRETPGGYEANSTLLETGSCGRAWLPRPEKNASRTTPT